MTKYRALQWKDVTQVQAVALKAWKYTYRNIYLLRTIKRNVANYYSTESFQKFHFPRMRTGDEWFYVAVDGKWIIGYSNIGKVKQGWELFRIYLLSEYIGKGIGRKLLQLGERFLTKKRARSYFLYVHSKNKLGKRFYLRNGFVRVKKKDRGPTSQYLEKKLTH